MITPTKTVNISLKRNRHFWLLHFVLWVTRFGIMKVSFIHQLMH